MFYYFMLLLAITRILCHHDLTVKEIIASWSNVEGPYKTKCLSATNATQEMFDQFYKCGVNTDDHRWKCCLRCLAAERGFFNTETGEIDPKKVAELFEGIGTDLAYKCAVFKSADQCQDVYDAAQCCLEGVKAKYPFE